MPELRSNEKANSWHWRHTRAARHRATARESWRTKTRESPSKLRERPRRTRPGSRSASADATPPREGEESRDGQIAPSRRAALRRGAGEEEGADVRDTEADMPRAEARGAMCVQRFDDSLNSAIHITYRISLRSSSMPEPRDPLLKVLTYSVQKTQRGHTMQ